jgi:feruloyl-CoA synthase
LIGALSPLCQDVVLAGLNQDFVAALIVPDLQACANALKIDAPLTHADLAVRAEILELIRERLRAHARTNPGSSTCIKRAVLLASSPSLDHGEITDKGSINQRAVLRCRADLVATLYDAEPPPHVVRIV